MNRKNPGSVTKKKRRKSGTKMPQPVGKLAVETGPSYFEGNPSIGAVRRRPDSKLHGDAGQDCYDRLPIAIQPSKHVTTHFQ
jgi:hypothetical protein